MRTENYYESIMKTTVVIINHFELLSKIVMDVYGALVISMCAPFTAN